MSDFDLSKITGNEPPLETESAELARLREENRRLRNTQQARVSALEGECNELKATLEAERKEWQQAEADLARLRGELAAIERRAEAVEQAIDQARRALAQHTEGNMTEMDKENEHQRSLERERGKA